MKGRDNGFFTENQVFIQFKTTFIQLSNTFLTHLGTILNAFWHWAELNPMPFEHTMNAFCTPSVNFRALCVQYMWKTLNSIQNSCFRSDYRYYFSLHLDDKQCSKKTLEKWSVRATRSEKSVFFTKSETAVISHCILSQPNRLRALRDFWTWTSMHAYTKTQFVWYCTSEQ